MSVTLSINNRAFGKQLTSSISRLNNQTQILNSIFIKNKPLKKRFEELKKEMINEFLMHPITKEILGGPGAPNISGTLRGYGNLFSFIGFNKGDKPIAPIVKLLEQTVMNVSRVNPRGVINLNITIPSNRDIFAVTPMPWATGLSWAQRIEQGMPGFGEYLNKSSSSSRSSQGLQTQNDIRSGGFSNAPYISSFVKKWQDIFTNIHKQ